MQRKKHSGILKYENITSAVFSSTSFKSIKNNCEKLGIL